MLSLSTLVVTCESSSSDCSMASLLHLSPLSPLPPPRSSLHRNSSLPFNCQIRKTSPTKQSPCRLRYDRIHSPIRSYPKPVPSSLVPDDAGGEIQSPNFFEFVTSERVKVVAMLGLALALCNADRVVMSVAIVPLSKAHGWSQSFAGIVQVLYFFFIITLVMKLGKCI